MASPNRLVPNVDDVVVAMIEFVSIAFASPTAAGVLVFGILFDGFSKLLVGKVLDAQRPLMAAAVRSASVYKGWVAPLIDLALTEQS
jgi:hypothetical protein